MAGPVFKALLVRISSPFLELFWSHFGDILALFWLILRGAHLGVPFDVFWSPRAPFWEVILGTFWLMFEGVFRGVFWSPLFTRH